MREKGSWSSATHEKATHEAKKHGSATFRGEQRAREGRGLDPLVDPSKYEVIRQARNLIVPDEDGWLVLKFGVAMPVKQEFDTTGSMGENVEIAFRVLPKVQDLLVQGPNAVLRRYHTQIATGAVQDRSDDFPYQIGQFEPDNEVASQMTLLFPEKKGGDATEDYQIGLFSTAYLTGIDIAKYGLKGYYFVAGDEIGRDRLDEHSIESVFGPSVMEKAFGVSKPQSLPSTIELGQKVLENWHTFFLQVASPTHLTHTTEWWSKVLGRERVILLPDTKDLAEVQAVIIGLTEGVLDLQSAVDFLAEAKVSKAEAQRIVRAVAHIPIGAQTKFPNFKKIPMAGAVFASKDDIWPINGEDIKSSKVVKPAKPGKYETEWKL